MSSAIAPIGAAPPRLARALGARGIACAAGAPALLLVPPPRLPDALGAPPARLAGAVAEAVLVPTLTLRRRLPALLHGGQGAVIAVVPPEAALVSPDAPLAAAIGAYWRQLLRALGAEYAGRGVGFSVVVAEPGDAAAIAEAVAWILGRAPGRGVDEVWLTPAARGPGPFALDRAMSWPPAAAAPAAVVLVTGAAGGIGSAIAGRFAATGARVVAFDRDRRRLAALADTLGGRCHPVAVDVTDGPALAAALAALPPALRAIDLAVNASGHGIGLGEPFHTVRPRDLAALAAAQVAGATHLMRLVVPGMRRRGRGQVITFGSIAADYPFPGAHVYAAGKAFQQVLSRGLRAHLVGTRLRFTVIEPGMVQSGFALAKYRGDRARAVAEYRAAHALQPEDMAALVMAASTQPSHVDLERIQVMPTTQALGPRRGAGGDQGPARGA